MALTARERTVFRNQVVAIVESCMSAAGWPGSRFRRSMRLFARPGDITPFFLLSNIAGRQGGGYVIEGGVGILHRSFEQHWSATAGGATDDGVLTMSLHSANVRELGELAYIDPHQPLETQVYPWCESAVAVLNSMPMTHAELALAYREKRLLAGHPLDHFLLLQTNDRQTAFRQWLEGAP